MLLHHTFKPLTLYHYPICVALICSLFLQLIGYFITVNQYVWTVLLLIAVIGMPRREQHSNCSLTVSCYFVNSCICMICLSYFCYVCTPFVVTSFRKNSNILRTISDSLNTYPVGWKMAEQALEELFSQTIPTARQALKNLSLIHI